MHYEKKQKQILKYERRHVEMRNEKLVYSTPSIKMTLVDEDILTFSPGEAVTFEPIDVTDKAAE